MADQNFNIKISKPTLKPPSNMGKKIDSGFKNKMRTSGLNINMIKESKTMINEREESLKKKIFSLPKMETLVMTDEYLSNIYNKLKQDAQETYGYHWNETIMNIMFNEYVLNDTAYLEKYKNTKTYNKKRRGEEGVEELEKNLQDKVQDKKDDGEKAEFNRDEKMSDVETNKDNLDKFKKGLKDEKMKDSTNEVAEQMKKALEEDEQISELFGFGKPQEPLATHKASKNDTYFVNKKNNSAVGVISANLPQQQNQDTASKYADANQYTKMPWYVAVTNKVKGVPAEVIDGSVADFQKDVNKYAGVPAMAESKEVKMTDGNGFELQFGTSTPAEAEKAAKKDSTYQNDVIYQNETTTSASSGAFVGPFPAKRKAVLDKPLWSGGVILKEASDYLTNPDAFKKFVEFNESVDKLEAMINESVDEGSGISIKQHAENIVNQLNRMKDSNPELSNMEEFNELVSLYSKRVQTGQVEDQPVQSSQQTDSTNQWKTNETPDHNAALQQDLKNTGRDVNGASTPELESKDGLFKGKWNENLTVNENQITNDKNIDAVKDNHNPPTAEKSGGDIFTRIGELVFPDSGKQAQELASLGQKFYNDFFRSVSADRAYEMLNNKFKELNLAESMIDDQPDSMARTMDSPELNTAGSGGGASSASAAPVAENDTDVETAAQGDRQDKEAIADADKFRNFLMSKYGVSSVADMSPVQKRQVMKDLAAEKGGATQQSAEVKPELDLKNFAASDADKAAYKSRDNKQLDFLAANNNTINTLQDYLALEKKYGAENGERMFHPMAILASIQAMQPNEKASFNNVERVLSSRLKGGIGESTKQNNKAMNEERLTPSMLNLQNVKKETAKLTQKDMAASDALKQAKVYPNPDEFYIEQDEEKIQNYKTAQDLEDEAMKKMEEKKALENAGDSTNDNGKELVKRNLTKDEMLRLAMDRGDGMHNIVYDNEPSEKFEKRLEKDMGADQYKLRQEKMDYREKAPMYNKDTQPTEKGDDKLQDDKYKVGFNEAFTGKYTDDFGKTKLVEFVVSEVKEVDNTDGGFKLTLEGLGNKYTVKINENQNFADIINEFDFYLLEGNVVKIKSSKSDTTSLNESALDKMKHLMGYNANDFVNTKKSIKF